MTESHTCGHNGSCENREGTYTCRCHAGFEVVSHTSLRHKKCAGKRQNQVVNSFFNNFYLRQKRVYANIRYLSIQVH